MVQDSAAGLLMCRWSHASLAYFLVHPGGPFYRNKEEGVWSIPKGLPEEGEDFLQTARREFFEETGIVPAPPYYPLGTIMQKSGKVVHAWTFLGEWEPETGIKCNTFSLEWPPRSGKKADFPEVDRAKWMSFEEAASMMLPAQRPFLGRAKDIYASASM